MDKASFAELKERFNKINVAAHLKPPPTTADHGSSSDLTSSEKLKSDTTKQPSDHVRSRSANPSDELKETTSPHETKLTQSRPNLANVVPTKKPPVPLPRPTTQLPDRKNSIESSAVLHQSLMPLVVSPPTLPVSSSPVEDSIYMEVVTDFSDPSYSSDISEMSTSSKNVDQLRMTVPIPPPPNPRKNSRADLSVVSLETTLPSKCMFFDFETTINGYHRRDPRTIIYPRTKSIMPKMTSDEINTLQRYFNT